MKKALKIASNTLAAVVLLLAFLLYGLQLFGIKPYVVLSGSMQAVYPTGSIIYVADVLPEKLEVGDVITFRLSGGTVVTHRIIERIPDENDADLIRFRTKGDENPTADGTLVASGDVVGKPLFGIPLLGYFAAYLATPLGKCVFFVCAAALLLADTLVRIAWKIADKKQTDMKYSK